jgi:hypothetical protein
MPNGKISEKPVDIVRITLTNSDGTAQEINLTEDLHFLLGFVTVGPEGGSDVPVEFIVKGKVAVVGEIYYQAGRNHPELVAHCKRRDFEKSLEQLRAKGIDPISEAFRLLPVVGGNQ